MVIYYTDAGQGTRGGARVRTVPGSLSNPSVNHSIRDALFRQQIIYTPNDVVLYDRLIQENCGLVRLLAVGSRPTRAVPGGERTHQLTTPPSHTNNKGW